MHQESLHQDDFEEEENLSTTIGRDESSISTGTSSQSNNNNNSKTSASSPNTNNNNTNATTPKLDRAHSTTNLLHLQEQRERQLQQLHQQHSAASTPARRPPPTTTQNQEQQQAASPNTLLNSPSSDYPSNNNNNNQNQLSNNDNSQYQHQENTTNDTPTSILLNLEPFRTLDVHTVLRGKRDLTEGFIPGEKGARNVRPITSRQDSEIMDQKMDLVAKCCSVGASVSLDDAFYRPQSVYCVKNKRQQMEILSGGGGSSQNNNNQDKSSNTSSMMMNMTSAILASQSGGSSYNYYNGGGGGGSGGGGGGKFFDDGGSNSNNRAKYLRADRWRWTLNRFQHKCQKCGGPAVDYVMVVTTHTNTNSSRVVAVLFSDSFPCVNDVHRHTQQTRDIFRKQEALLLQNQGKIANLISHIEMMPCFDVLKLRDDVIAPYWEQLLITKNLRTPCAFNESALMQLQQQQQQSQQQQRPGNTSPVASTASGSTNVSANFGGNHSTSTYGGAMGGGGGGTMGLMNSINSQTPNLNNNMSPASLPPPRDGQLHHLQQLQTTHASVVTASTIATNSSTAGSGGNPNVTSATSGVMMKNPAFPTTPAITTTTAGLSQPHQQQISSPIYNNPSTNSNQQASPVPAPPPPQTQTQQSHPSPPPSSSSPSIDAQLVLESIDAIHLILSYRSVVLLGANHAKRYIRGWLDFFRAIYEPNRIVLPEPISVPPLPSERGSQHQHHSNNTASSASVVGSSGVSNVSFAASTSTHLHPHATTPASVQSGRHQHFDPSSIPPTPNVTSTSSRAPMMNSDKEKFISLFLQKKFNWLPLPHVAAQAFCSTSIEHDLLPTLKKLDAEDFERDPMQTPIVCVVDDKTGALLIPQYQIAEDSHTAMMIVDTAESSKMLMTLKQILTDIMTEQRIRQVIVENGRNGPGRNRHKMNLMAAAHGDNNNHGSGQTKNNNNNQQKEKEEKSGFFSSWFGSGNKNKNKKDNIDQQQQQQTQSQFQLLTRDNLHHNETRLSKLGQQDNDDAPDHQNTNNNNTADNLFLFNAGALSSGGGGADEGIVPNVNNNNDFTFLDGAGGGGGKPNLSVGSLGDGQQSESGVSLSGMTVASLHFKQNALLSRNCCDSSLFRSASFWATWCRRFSHLPNKWDLSFVGLGSDRDAPYWMEKKKIAVFESQLRM